jgi:hypothetical protein
MAGERHKFVDVSFGSAEVLASGAGLARQPMPASRNSATAWVKSVTSKPTTGPVSNVFQSEDYLIVAGTLYIEDFATGPVGIEQAVQDLVWQRPQTDERDHTVGISGWIHSTSRPGFGMRRTGSADGRRMWIAMVGEAPGERGQVRNKSPGPELG